MLLVLELYAANDEAAKDSEIYIRFTVVMMKTKTMFLHHLPEQDVGWHTGVV